MSNAAPRRVLRMEVSKKYIVEPGKVPRCPRGTTPYFQTAKERLEANSNMGTICVGTYVMAPFGDHWFSAVVTAIEGDTVKLLSLCMWWITSCSLKQVFPVAALSVERHFQLLEYCSDYKIRVKPTKIAEPITYDLSDLSAGGLFKFYVFDQMVGSHITNLSLSPKEAEKFLTEWRKNPNMNRKRRHPESV